MSRPAWWVLGLGLILPRIDAARRAWDRLGRGAGKGAGPRTRTPRGRAAEAVTAR